LKSKDIGLEDQEATKWDVIVQRFSVNNVHIKEEEDLIVWAKNVVGGFYTTRLGYEAMYTNDQVQIKQWWKKKVWKIRATLKTRIFLWMALSNEILTWGNVLKRPFGTIFLKYPLKARDGDLCANAHLSLFFICLWVVNFIWKYGLCQ
jgi:hypothetical protein